MKKVTWITMILVVVSIIGCSVENETYHEHIFGTEWLSDSEKHWKTAICEHENEVSEKAEHTFGKYVSNNDATTEKDGTKTRKCRVCKYEDTVKDEDSKIHMHSYSTDWSYDSAYHWKAAICKHSNELSEKSTHVFNGTTCTICEYVGFVLIKAGTFKMGSTAGNDGRCEPVHKVTITKDFYMGKYEVTQAEYENHCSYGKDSPGVGFGKGDNYPVYFVSWYDSLVYCNKRSIAEGLTPCYSIEDSTDPDDWGSIPTYHGNSKWNTVICDWDANGYRLPTEAEWEYAARAGDDTVATLTYSGTKDVNKLGDFAWYYRNSNDATHQVGTKKANAFGLYDMSGNVAELCWNWFTSRYDEETEGGTDPTGALWGDSRVVRGGDRYFLADSCAVSSRSYCYPCNRSYTLHIDEIGFYGFRVVRAISK